MTHDESIKAQLNYILDNDPLNLLSPKGYYIMQYGAERYTSVAWYATKQEAQKELDRMLTVGAWRGLPPKIVQG